MTDLPNLVAGYVDALLKNRRPPRFRSEAEEGEALRVAAMLRAGSIGADVPDQAFVERLRLRLADAAEQPDQRGVSRRRLLRRISIPSLAALVGAASGAVLRELSEQLGGSQRTQELVPSEAGAWMAVTPLESLAVGQPVLFTVGAIRGFLIRHGDADVMAISAVCSHLGCLLATDAQRGRLDCPCHGAAFTLDGTPLNPDYTTPLPRLRARIASGTVEVFAV